MSHLAAEANRIRLRVRCFPDPDPDSDSLLTAPANQSRSSHAVQLAHKSDPIRSDQIEVRCRQRRLFTAAGDNADPAYYFRRRSSSLVGVATAAVELNQVKPRARFVLPESSLPVVHLKEAAYLSPARASYLAALALARIQAESARKQVNSEQRVRPN